MILHRSLLLALLLSLISTACLAEPAIWQVKGKHNTLYLLGTIHMLPANESLPHNIERAYQQAGQLLMEIDLNAVDQLSVASLTMQLGLLPDGKTLSSLLDAQTQRKLHNATATLGISAEMLEPFQPWLAALTLEQLQYMKQGYTAESGIEMQLAQRAARDHKTTAGLETMEQQLNLLADQDMQAQRAYLVQTLDELSESPNEVQRLLQAWRSGDQQYLQTLLQDSLKQNPKLFARLVTERNQRWLNVLEPLLDKPGDACLVAVGAMHLVGPQGLVALLKQAGYQITRQ